MSPTTIGIDLVNLKDLTLPTEFKTLISLGEKFSVNRGVPHIPYFQLIADVEIVLAHQRW